MMEWNPKTTQADLWLIRGDQPFFQIGTGVECAEVFHKSTLLPWECGKCGRLNKEPENCGGCGAPFFNRVRAGRLVLHTRWRNAHQLAVLNKGDVLEVRAAECGRRDCYESGVLLIRLRLPRVVRTWVDGPVPLYAEDARLIEYSQEIHGEIIFRTI